MPDILVVANAPYVALIDSKCWQVKYREVLVKNCTKEDIKIQHLLLQHVKTSEKCRCFNAHIPSTVGTVQRKKDCALRCCDIATRTDHPWILAGDFNVNQASMAFTCQAFIEKNVPCFSKSEWPQSDDAQKADFALSQGIALMSLQSWVGFHSQPCASDIHDAVVVIGAFKAKDPQPTFTKPPLANSVWSRRAAGRGSAASSGVPQPATHIDNSTKIGPAAVKLETLVSSNDEPARSSSASAPREKLAEVVAPDTSGVPQPADTGDELHKATQAADENIYLSAIAVNVLIKR